MFLFTRMSPMVTIYIYDGCNVTNSRILLVVQNNALRAVMGVKAKSSATKLHQDTNIEWLDVDRTKSTCIQVYKSIHGLNPNNMANMFVINDTCRKLRSSEVANIYRSRTITELGDKNLRVRGYYYWLDLPLDIKNCPTFASFKRAIKRYSGFKHVK